MVPPLSTGPPPAAASDSRAGDGRAVAGIVAPPPLLYAVPLALMLVVHHFWPVHVLPARAATVIGPILVALGCIGFVAIAAFRRAHTSPSPYRATAALVTSGPYRVSRNPMYVGFTCFYLGAACWVNSLWPLLALPVVLVVIQRGVIAREEAYLERRFGDEYRAYRAAVRRWL